jgi:hypothetical protein
LLLHPRRVSRKKEHIKNNLHPDGRAMKGAVVAKATHAGRFGGVSAFPIGALAVLIDSLGYR